MSFARAYLIDSDYWRPDVRSIKLRPVLFFTVGLSLPVAVFLVLISIDLDGSPTVAASSSNFQTEISGYTSGCAQAHSSEVIYERTSLFPIWQAHNEKIISYGAPHPLSNPFNQRNSKWRHLRSEMYAWNGSAWVWQNTRTTGLWSTDGQCGPFETPGSQQFTDSLSYTGGALVQHYNKSSFQTKIQGIWITTTKDSGVNNHFLE